MAERRRLPVLQNKAPAERREGGDESGESGDGEDVPRPPLHWIGFGVVAIFAAWLPLTYVAGAISQKVLAGRFGADASKDAIALAMSTMTSDERARLMAIVALPTFLALAVAAFAGGFVVGRFGRDTGAGTSAWAGVVSAILASALAWSGVTAPALVGAVVTLAVAAGFAAWGGRVGAARRPAGS